MGATPERDRRPTAFVRPRVERGPPGGARRGTLRPLHKQVGDTVVGTGPARHADDPHHRRDGHACPRSAWPVRPTSRWAPAPSSSTTSSRPRHGISSRVTPGPNAILVRTKGGASPQALRSLQAIGHEARHRDQRRLGASRCSDRRRSSTTARWAPHPFSSGAPWPPAPRSHWASRSSPRCAGGGVTSPSSRRSGSPAAAGRRPSPGRPAWLPSSAAPSASRSASPSGVSCGTSSPARSVRSPLPTVPAGTVAVIGFLAVALAVLVATVPGRLAARTRTSQLLRSRVARPRRSSVGEAADQLRADAGARCRAYPSEC